MTAINFIFILLYVLQLSNSFVGPHHQNRIDIRSKALVQLETDQVLEVIGIGVAIIILVKVYQRDESINKLNAKLDSTNFKIDETRTKQEASSTRLNTLLGELGITVVIFSGFNKVSDLLKNLEPIAKNLST